MKRKTFFNVLLILFVASFFVTPLGEFSKVLLYRVFADTPSILPGEKQERLMNYDWKLLDENHNEINFKESKGRVIFVNFWASWIVPCTAELHGIQKLYDLYQGRIDFYIITNEEREVVEEFMEKKKFTFPVTYLLMEEKPALETKNVPSTFIINKRGDIVVHQIDIAKWGNNEVYDILDALIKE